MSNYYSFLERIIGLEGSVLTNNLLELKKLILSSIKIKHFQSNQNKTNALLGYSSDDGGTKKTTAQGWLPSLGT